MYRVYSMQKPVHAWRGVVATAMLLVATAAAGWVLVERKRAERFVELDEPIDLRSPAVRLRVPRGWPGASEQLNQMAVALFVEPSVVMGRVLCVASWSSGQAPARQLAAELAWQLAPVGLQFHHRAVGARDAPLASLDGWQVRGVWRGRRGPGDVLARVACTSAGRAYGLVLRGPGSLGSADEALFDAICASVELNAADPNQP